MRTFIVIGMVAFTACRHGSPTPRGNEMSVEPVIYFNANVVTLDPERPGAAGVRVEGDRITHVFDGEPSAEFTGTRVDLEGATVLPGLVDAHLHLQGIGEAARVLDLRGTGSVAEVVAKVRAADATGGWILGEGWDQNDWSDATFPSAAALAAVGDVPIMLTRIDGHAVWVNQVALTLAGVGANTPDPDGGEVLRDPDGRPTGVLVDNAIDLVKAHVPVPTPNQIRADLERAIAMCNRVGLTGAHDMGVTPAVLEALKAIAADGKLTLRVTAYLHGNTEELAPLLSEGPRRSGVLRVLGVKLYTDGALGSRGAALLAPYSDRPETSGLLVTTVEEMNARVRDVHARGYQVAIHAIGDRGVRVALDAIALAQGADTSRRHRIEHAQVVATEDIGRFAELGVVASMQPTHATSDMPWAEDRVGPERIAGAYAWRTLTNAGAVLVLGSDAPVESHNPWFGIYAAITRQDSGGQPAGGWRPSERLSSSEAIAGFSRGAAYASGDDDLGVIRPGALADLTVVEREPASLAPLELVSIEVLRTVVGGRQVYPRSRALPGE